MTIRRGIVDTPYGQVHARAVGGEGRPMLLLHQSPRSGLMYEPLMEHIPGSRGRCNTALFEGV